MSLSLSFFKPTRCVLLIGDEALYVFNVGAGAVKLIASISWQAEKFDETVVELIRKECGGKSVLILNDMTDQHFKGGQRLPKVGIMDRANVLARKLQVAFPSYAIRGSLEMEQAKDAVSADGQTGKVYLFAGVNMSEPVSRTMQVAKNSLSTISGFYLLPIELSDMVKTLAEKLTAKGRPVARWVIFMGQHHSGALRQVITRDGQLAMTRMTPVADNAAADPAAWAQDVFQEFKATIGYLSRFGFVPEDGLEVILVSQPVAGEAFGKLLDVPCHYSTFTAPEAARELGMTIGLQENPHYADVLHAAWVGRKSRFILPMQADELKKVSQPRQIAAGVVLLLILGIGYLGWQSYTQMQSASETEGHITTQERTLKQVTADYESEEDKMKALGFDVKLVQGASKTYKDLESKRIHELTMIKKIHEALGDSMRLDELSIDDMQVITPGAAPTPSPSATPAPPANSAPGAPPPTAPMNVELKLSFPPSTQIEEGVRQVNNLKRRLEVALPNCVVTIKKNVAGLEYSDTFSGEASAEKTPAADKSQQYIADLSIKGSP